MPKRLFAILALALALLITGCQTLTPDTPTPVPTDTAVPPTATLPIANATSDMDATATAVFSNVDIALKAAKMPEGEIAATVNGLPVSSQRYEDELNRQLLAITEQYQVDWTDPQTIALLPQVQDSILEQLIDQELLPQLAASENISVTQTALDAEIASLKTTMVSPSAFSTWEDFLAYNKVTDEEVRTIVNNSLLVNLMVDAHGGNPEAEQVHAAHILVSSEITATEVMTKLAQGESFESLAAEYSIDTGTKDNGGDLGWFPKGAMVPEFEDVAFSLPVGETSQPFQSQYGYHIVRVLGHETRPLEGQYATTAKQEAFSTWYEDERAKADIVRNIQFDVPTPTPAPPTTPGN